MNNLEKEILIKLIGLARATSGNEDLVTPLTMEVILDALKKPSADCLMKIEEEKRKLVPNCFYCTNPCGKTADPKNIEFNDVHTEIYTNLLKSINCIYDFDENAYNFIFLSLYYLGENEYLNEAVLQLQSMKKELIIHD